MSSSVPEPVASASREALVEVDGRDRVVGWSRDAEELLGFRAATARGRGFCELLEARDLWGNRGCTCGIHESLRESEPLRTFLIDVRTATGETIRLVVHPAATARGKRADSVLVYRLRRDLRRRQDRRRPAHPAERRGVAAPRTPASPSTLSPREIDVLRLLAAGTSTASIAQSLGISVVTVRNHVQRLLDRLGSHSRLEAVARARERGWID